MAVMTHAQNQATEADYNQLTAAQQDKFDRLMEDADVAGHWEYIALMAVAAAWTGLPMGDIRKCGCSCWCPVIFDANHPDVHVIEHGEGYNLGRHQCAWCADQHQETA